MDFQSVVIVILSKTFYKTKDCLTITINDEPISMNRMAELLCGNNCINLVGRPKLFLLLAEKVVDSPIGTDCSPFKAIIFKLFLTIVPLNGKYLKQSITL